MKKLAIITTHPMQYYAPIFLLLSQRKKIAIKVFYTLGEGAANKFDHGFNKVIEWDVPLLEGYEFEWMKKINEEQKLLAAVNARGKAANSDHYFFTEKGVPSFFFYTLGGIKAYHDVFDKPGTLPLNEHEDLFKLIVAFNKKLMGQ